MANEVTHESMLTTVDNPFSPFTEFRAWFAFDTAAGYNTSGFLDRIAKTSDELSETDHQLAIEQAIDEIVAENVLGLYRKVIRGSDSDRPTPVRPV